MKIAIQGASGSFHQIAAEHYYGQNDNKPHTFVCCDNFKDVFEAIQSGRAEAGVVAVENSLYGSINEVYDLLLQYRIPIVGEVSEQINQNLIALPSTKLQDIREIYSHPVALAQCTTYLDSHMPQAERHEYHDTAAAVEYLTRHPGNHRAAIASRRAADLYGAIILESNIQNEQYNFTRFLVLESTTSGAPDADKASLMLMTPHDPGALHKALGVFAELGCNLTKLQSRPIPGELWKYQFYLDVMADTSQMVRIRADLAKQGCELTQLGIYRASQTTHQD